ncbi:MAG: hypothetical protein HY700_14840 [Gemmatimonadetes bacterium]|nr:hypothetical protein [Gemmatimonadota bacterium]
MNWVLRYLAAFAAIFTVSPDDDLRAQHSGEPADAPAAATVARVTPGPEYQAGKLHQALFGSNYRHLWTTQVTVPVLDLRGFAGGLEPTERHEGRQTVSLRFQGADGREYRECPRDICHRFGRSGRVRFREYSGASDARAARRREASLGRVSGA